VLRPGGAYDRFVSGLAAQDQFSGTVLLAWRGEPVLVRSYHQANAALNIPNRADTIFNLGSVTKFLTGAAVVQLAAQGKIDFFAPLGSYLDGFPAEAADSVTVHNLLTHTSGYPADVTISGPPPTWTTVQQAFDDTLASLQQVQLQTAPGTRYTYSDSNYFLAGAVIGAASGQPFWDYMPQRVFGPAGMTRTGFYTGEQWLTDRRIAHDYGPAISGQRQDITQGAAAGAPVNGWTGAGWAFSTAPDLLRFARALTDGTLLPRPWAEVLASGKYPISPAQHFADEPPGTTLIGYGPEERITGGQRAYGHTGAVEVRVKGSTQPGGSSAGVSIYPDLDVVAVVLSNYFLYPGLGGFLAQQDQIITQHAS